MIDFAGDSCRTNATAYGVDTVEMVQTYGTAHRVDTVYGSAHRVRGEAREIRLDRRDGI